MKSAPPCSIPMVKHRAWIYVISCCYCCMVSKVRMVNFMHRTIFGPIGVFSINLIEGKSSLRKLCKCFCQKLFDNLQQTITLQAFIKLVESTLISLIQSNLKSITIDSGYLFTHLHSIKLNYSLISNIELSNRFFRSYSINVCFPLTLYRSTKTRKKNSRLRLMLDNWCMVYALWNVNTKFSDWHKK